MTIFQLSKEIFFPPPTLAQEDGLLAVGGDLSEARLLTAYQMGIFPWYSEGDPILWWAPVPRLILRPNQFKLNKRMRRYLKGGKFHFSMDRSFPEVIQACAESRVIKGEATWINQELIEAYCRLHHTGYAHSVECWQDDKLVGGLYGVAIGAVFCGESMFSLVSNSSKASLAVLASTLKEWDFEFIDCQMRTEHLISQGAEEVSGSRFFSWLQQAIFKEDRCGRWELPEVISHQFSNSNEIILTPGDSASSFKA